MIRETKCRRCGKPIVMIKTIKHKTMPADAEPLWIRLGVMGSSFSGKTACWCGARRPEMPPMMTAPSWKYSDRTSPAAGRAASNNII